jgi:hypothetical protein
MDASAPRDADESHGLPKVVGDGLGGTFRVGDGPGGAVRVGGSQYPAILASTPA